MALYIFFPKTEEADNGTKNNVWRNNAQEFSRTDQQHLAIDAGSTTDPRKSTEKTTARHIMIKLLKTQDKVKY